MVVPVLTNDFDQNLDPSTLTVWDDANWGSAVISGSGVAYTPDPDFNGSDFFKYSVCDTDGVCRNGRVDVTVHPVNDPPVADNDEATTDAGNSVNIAVLDNDFDADGDPLVVATFDAASALGGSVDCTAGAGTICTYDPPAAWDGAPDTFTYLASDGNGGVATALVTITQSGA